MNQDNRGRGPDDEGRIERHPSRPYENPVKEQQKKTQKQSKDALNNNKK